MKASRALVALSVLLAAPAVALAARAYVQSFGEVDLAPFQCEAIPHSPNVRRICYDAKRQYALVSLSGVWYRYCGVPATTMGEWKRSLSKGRFYNDRIRGSFDCTTSNVDQSLREVDSKAPPPGQPQR
jgi:hypothetical protein